MSHFAKIDIDNVVTAVIVSEKDFINSGIVGDEFLWIQTSYNGNFRKNFAEIGGYYDNTLNAFISKQPFSSWVLNNDTCQWEAPMGYPEGLDSINLLWNEATTSWDEVIDPSA